MRKGKLFWGRTAQRQDEVPSQKIGKGEFISLHNNTGNLSFTRWGKQDHLIPGSL